MNDYELELYRYIIQIGGPRVLKPNGEKEQLFTTDKYGDSSVHVYRTAEGTTPSTSSDIGHLLLVGTFKLQPREGKTAEEFMREIKEGLVKLVSSQK